MKRWGASLATGAMIIIAVVLSAPSASASEAQVARDDVAAVMDAVPGGVLVDADHAVWPSIGMEMTSAEAAGVFSVGSCATGSVCAFSGANLSGSKLSWSTCSTFTISAFTVRSIADARSSGYLQARNGTTVVATANAGASANVFGTVTNVRCVS
ncbi:peptidase inhibitor family I36 protein [Microbacterium sp. 22195]|uniref:peptidase inhibitor family I36 protein n=1 Tax=Microbacterium sp. 22195 TaxID=3453891 RepID=UPI003F831B66